MTVIANKLPSIIDIEASGFGQQSYPIEVGIVMSNGSRYCRLIKPFQDWHHWNPEAEGIHGISRDVLLKEGENPITVCHELNDFVGDNLLYSDAWVVDYPWLLTLFARSAVKMKFSISSLELILTEDQLSLWDRNKEIVVHDSKLVRHRASSDASIVQQTYQRSLLHLI